MAQLVKNPTVNAEDTRGMSLIPWLGRYPGKGNSSPLKYSCLGNPMNRGVWWATVHGVTKELDMTRWLNNNNMGLSYMAFIIWGVLLLRPIYRVFNHERILNFVRCFFCIKEIIWFLSFIQLMWCIKFTDMHMLNHPCKSRVNPTFSQCMILLVWWWIWFLSIFWEILHL